MQSWSSNLNNLVIIGELALDQVSIRRDVTAPFFRSPAAQRRLRKKDDWVGPSLKKAGADKTLRTISQGHNGIKNGEQIRHRVQQLEK